MLPDGSGLELLKQLRGDHPDLPVLMLSARGEPLDRILGLELGATTTWPSPATRANSPHGCAPCCGEPTRRNPARRCNWATCR